MKRLFDIILSVLGIVILFPVFVILIILVSCTSHGGPFFCGPRVGKKGKIFKIIKFRSMKANCEGKGAWNISEKDPRVTKIGLFLRKSKLDELPQLFNIFVGQMSFVGPRPELQYYVDMYTDEEKAILDNKPGMTDWASIVNAEQIVEFTNAQNADEAYLYYIRPLKIKLQLHYCYHNNLLVDLKCILWTFWKLISRTKKVPQEIRAIVDSYQKERKLDS
ncbi:MAG: sugar transferase [Bacilli bacterium]|jgi:lipopolysaccharide/colanic/teichoic acid biosynthesis glycosyltransferase|nr:sugar transferase [Bacilli bacterium]